MFREHSSESVPVSKRLAKQSAQEAQALQPLLEVASQRPLRPDRAACRKQELEAAEEREGHSGGERQASAAARDAVRVADAHILKRLNILRWRFAMATVLAKGGGGKNAAVASRHLASSGGGPDSLVQRVKSHHSLRI